MSHVTRRSLLLGVVSLSVAACRKRSEPLPAVRCAIIGGMTKTGMWQELARRFQATTGIASEVVVTGSRDVIAPAMREGRVDLITMHASDTMTALVTDGYAYEPRVWAENDHVIIGPKDDPAGIRGEKDAAQAVRRIVLAKALIILHGKADQVLGELAQSTGVSLDDTNTMRAPDGARHAETVQLAASKHAYSLVGRIPFHVGEAYPPGVELLVQGDPRLRKSYVVAVANPKRWPDARHESARRLVSYLFEPDTQAWLSEFGRGAPWNGPLFFPVASR
jgi:tungstate transport system substrate-binding protein